jgi:hypothetical protein
MDSFITGSFAKNNIFGDFIGLLSNYNIQGVYNIYTIDKSQVKKIILNRY